ncbi:MAG: hypothetical protein QOH75_783 [Actinomycetota bacterium]|nr:hypothetical protein [Actinomycetota bacterium]
MTIAATAATRRVASARPTPRAWGVPILAALVGLLAAVGGVLAVDLIRATPPPEVNAAGGSFGTSFGSVSVHQSEVVNGLSASSLGGMSHGIQGLVGAGKAEIALSVTVTNTSKHPVRYAADQFQLRTGTKAPKGKAFTAGGTSLSPGELARGGTVEGTLSFVVPVTSSRLWLQFRDGGRLINLPLAATAKDGPAVDGNGPIAPDEGHSGH